MRNKKSQSLSLQTIVIAALVLIVLIVLVIIFSSKTQPVADMYNKCTSIGEGTENQGHLVKVGTPCEEPTPYIHPLYRTEKDGEAYKCCVGELI